MVAEMTESITDLLHVPIVSTVASLISIILKAAKVSSQCYHMIDELLKLFTQDVKNNDDARFRLAQAAVAYLEALRPYLITKDEEDISEDWKVHLRKLLRYVRRMPGEQFLLRTVIKISRRCRGGSETDEE